jgi:hypothetical protein
MTGKRYYVTTLGEWKQSAASFTSSHWFALPSLRDAGGETVADLGKDCPASQSILDATSILALIEGDEGTHGMLDEHPRFEALPHPLSSKPLTEAVRALLAVHGVKAGASTLEVTDVIARYHPLLRHSVY